MKTYYRLPTVILLTFIALLWVSFSLNAQNWDQIIKGVASDRADNDNFGYSVAISGDYAIVGAYLEDEDASGGAYAFAAGSAYIFKLTGGVWVQQQKIVASDRAANDFFGYNVAISGDYAIVGAYQEDHDASGSSFMSNSGSAYIFKLTGSTWAQQQKIVASDRAANDYFGYSVAISGDYAIVGAYQEDQDASGGATATNAGSAYIFKLTGSSWAQQQKIVASDRAVNDRFGLGVAISGDYAIVGAYWEDEDASGGATATNAGSAYIFKLTGSSWAQQQKIVASDRAANDFFGYSVAISGDYAIVGAYWEDEDASGGATTPNAGSAYIFKLTGGVWAQQQKIVASDRTVNDYFGYSVAISGDYAIVGAYQQDQDASGSSFMSNSGSAYIFKLTGSTWAQQQKILASDRAGDDYFGYSVAISGDYAIVGANWEDEDASGGATTPNAGSAYFFGESPCSPNTSSFSVSICESYTVPSGDETYTVSDTYMDTIPSLVNGCDSVMTIDVTILQPTTRSFSVSVCETYTVPSGDETYTVSNTYMDTIPSLVNGCDSVMTIDVTVLQPTSSSFSVSVCESYTVPSGDETYTVSDTYMDTIPSLVNGCDSVMTIDVTILQPTTSSFSVSVCESYTVPSGDETYTVSDTYMDTIPSLVNGCDSVMTIDVTVLQPTSSSFSVSVCESYTVPSGDETYTVSDIYMDTIPSLVNGCDSVMTIDVTVNDLPDVGVTATDPTLTADAAGASYQWLDCDDSDAMIGGATDQAYMPLANGSFAVEVTENGCVDTSDCVSVFTVGIDNLKDELFQVYPNPTSNQVTIDLGSETSGSVRIFDVAGKTVYSEQITSSKATLDVSAIAEGVYTLQFVSETGLTKIQRVVKQ